MSNNNNIIISNEEKRGNINLIKDNEYEYISTKEKEKTKIKNNDLQKEPIYIMTLELEKGKPEKLKIFLDSDPLQIATDFCKEHNLDYNGLDYLRKRIENLLNQNNINLVSSKKDNIKQFEKSEYNLNINTNNLIKNKKSQSKDYNLSSPKQSIKNKKNNYNQEMNYIINNISSSKKQSHKCKRRILNNENSDKIFDKIYKEIKYKNSKENKYNNKLNIYNKTENNTEKIKKNNNKLKNYEILEERNKELKEKELFEIQKKLDNKKNKLKINSSFKNNRKRNYFDLSQNSKYNINKIDNRVSKILKEYEEKYSFHPSINENYKTDLTFDQRQTIFKNLYKKKKEELKNYYLYSNKDENGNLFFKPKIISKPKYINEENKSINNNGLKENDVFNKNYFYWKKYSLDKEELYKKYYNNNVNYEPMIYTKKQNEKIMNQVKIRAFKNLFKDLDADQDNLINGINMNIKKIPSVIYKIIEPLLNELKEDNQSLNEEEFLIAMTKLFKDISSIEKRTIINIYSKNLKKNKTLNSYNYLLEENNVKKRALTPNFNNNDELREIHCNDNKTNKLAFKHYKKISLMFEDLYKSKYYDNINENKKTKLKKNIYFGTENNQKDDNFVYIRNYSYNNFLKNLN